MQKALVFSIFVFSLILSGCDDPAGAHLPAGTTPSAAIGQPSPSSGNAVTPSPPSVPVVAAIAPLAGEPLRSEITLDTVGAAPDDDSKQTEAITWQIPGVPQSDAAALFVSGVDGGFVQPADEIYSVLAEKLARMGVPSIFVRYRDPGVVNPSVQDAFTGAQYLRAHGAKRMAMIGWSFGGAVLANAGTQIPEVKTIVGFSIQSLDTDAFANLHASQSVLLFHSQDDENVPYWAAGQIQDEIPADVPVTLKTLTGADHQLDGEGSAIEPIAENWIFKHL